jgi:hypothetical protein
MKTCYLSLSRLSQVRDLLQEEENFIVTLKSKTFYADDLECLDQELRFLRDRIMSIQCRIIARMEANQ